MHIQLTGIVLHCWQYSYSTLQHLTPLCLNSWEKPYIHLITEVSCHSACTPCSRSSISVCRVEYFLSKTKVGLYCYVTTFKCVFHCWSRPKQLCKESSCTPIYNVCVCKPALTLCVCTQLPLCVCACVYRCMSCVCVTVSVVSDWLCTPVNKMWPLGCELPVREKKSQYWSRGCVVDNKLAPPCPPLQMLRLGFNCGTWVGKQRSYRQNSGARVSGRVVNSSHNTSVYTVDTEPATFAPLPCSRWIRIWHKFCTYKISKCHCSRS